jgi:hypothetical protein
MRILVVATVLGLFLLPGLAMADLDEAGNLTDAVIGPDPGPPDGAQCGTCPAPAGDRGVDFKNGELYVIAGNQIHHYVNCQVVGSTTIQGITNAFGLGYDTLRDLWIVTDPGADRVYQVNMGGAVVNSWPSPAAGPVGAAYDSNRDLYLIADFAVDAITRLNPTTGLPVAPIAIPAGSRICGTGFDPGPDLIFYHGRDQAVSYCISAATGALFFSLPIPDAAPGSNNGQGAGVAPDGNGWLSHFEQPTLYCIVKDIATPVEQTTWGAIKGIYE